MTPNPGVKLRTTRDAQKEGPMTTDTPPSALDAAEARLRKLEARISVAPFVEIPTATGDFMRALRNDALAVIDGLRAQLAEARAERRELAQKIIAEIGAPGPETLEETVTRLLSQVAAQLAEARAETTYLRPSVFAFARLMEMKLRENDQKGGWKYCTRRYLLVRLRNETNELSSLGPTAEPKDIGRECADVANFAMMIADNGGALAATPREGPP